MSSVICLGLLHQPSKTELEARPLRLGGILAAVLSLIGLRVRAL